MLGLFILPKLPQVISVLPQKAGAFCASHFRKGRKLPEVRYFSDRLGVLRDVDSARASG